MSKPRRFTPARIAAFILIVAGLFIFDGSRKIPTPFASGNALHPAPTAPVTPPADFLRVATVNIAGGVGKTDGRKDLDRTAAALQGFDLIGLQEVHGGNIFGSPDQAQLLGQKLNLPWLFAPVEHQWWRDAFGDGILTSRRVTHWQRIPLAGAAANSNRELLWVQLDFAGQSVNVLITHLSRDADREAELRTAITLFKSLQTPVILMGDLNSNKDDPQIADLRKDPSVADPVGDALNPKMPETIDWIFARHLKASQ